MTMKVMVLGHGNNGKSTLLNALLGQQLLPANATPLTANLTTISAGSQVDDRFRRCPAPGQHGRWEQLRPPPPAESDDEGEEEGEEEEEEFSRLPREFVETADQGNVEIELHPTPGQPTDYLLRNGVQLVDVPGLGQNQDNSEEAQSGIRDAKVLLIVCSADHGAITATEKDLLAEYGRQANLEQKLFVVCNKMDGVQTAQKKLKRPEAQRILERVSRCSPDALPKEELARLLSLPKAQDKVVINRAEPYRGPSEKQVNDVKQHVQNDLIKLFPGVFPDREATRRAVGETIHFVSGQPALSAQVNKEDSWKLGVDEFERMRERLVARLETNYDHIMVETPLCNLEDGITEVRTAMEELVRKLQVQPSCTVEECQADLAKARQLRSDHKRDIELIRIRSEMDALTVVDELFCRGGTAEQEVGGVLRRAMLAEIDQFITDRAGEIRDKRSPKEFETMRERAASHCNYTGKFQDKMRTLMRASAEKFQESVRKNCEDLAARLHAEIADIAPFPFATERFAFGPEVQVQLQERHDLPTEKEGPGGGWYLLGPLYVVAYFVGRTGKVPEDQIEEFLKKTLVEDVDRTNRENLDALIRRKSEFQKCLMETFERYLAATVSGPLDELVQDIAQQQAMLRQSKQEHKEYLKNARSLLLDIQCTADTVVSLSSKYRMCKHLCADEELPLGTHVDVPGLGGLCSYQRRDCQADGFSRHHFRLHSTGASLRPITLADLADGNWTMIGSVAQQLPTSRCHLHYQPAMIPEMQKRIEDSIKRTPTTTPAEALHGLSVKKVVRIENPDLFDRYQVSRDVMRGSIARLPQRPQRLAELIPKWLADKHYPEEIDETQPDNINEFWLWHGTLAWKILAEHGFDERVAGLPRPRQGFYGAGCYFADAASKSHQYARKDEDGLHCMLYCRVIMGSPYLAKTKFLDDETWQQEAADGRRPPQNPATPAKPYDSVFVQEGVTQRSSPPDPRRVQFHDEYVIFDAKAQVYPQWVVWYTLP
jgi:GTP-binding protein EngB required for normal cell division